MPSPASSTNVIKIISGSRGKFPIKLGLVPDQLAVTIYLHEETSIAGKIFCWSYLSEGLIKLDQKEILLTLRINEDEDRNKFPTSPLQVFLLLYKLATQQKQVDIGGIFKLGARGLFGFPGAGLTFLLNNPTQSILKQPTLSCILLTEEELSVAHNINFTRVVGRMGYEQNHYPCLPWNNRQRQGLPLRAMLQESAVKNTARLSMKHTACYMEGGETVVLNIPAGLRNLLIKAIAKNTHTKPLCLLTQLLPGHDGCLAWLPHKNASQIVSAPDSTCEFIGGSFLLLTPGQSSDGATMLEDGYTVTLKDESWQLFLSSLANGRDLLINGTGGNMNFALVCSASKAQMEKPFAHMQMHDEFEKENVGGFFNRFLQRLKKS
jgi:hypothetical protein